MHGHPSVLRLVSKPQLPTTLTRHAPTGGGRQLNWRQYTSAGKVAMFQLFVILPYFNALYWAVVWARRRARVAAKHNPV